MCGKNLSAGTVNNKLNRLRSFYHFLHKKRRIHSNPFDWVEAVRGAKSLPKNILSVEDMGKLLDRFAVKRDMDLMMRSVVEFLYGSALRISEVCALKEKGIDFDRGMLFITDFKNHEERRGCPATEVSLKVLRRYMRYSRKKLVGESEREKGGRMKESEIMQKAQVLFSEHLAGRGLEKDTIRRKMLELKRFFAYLIHKERTNHRAVGSGEIEEYFLALKEKGLSSSTLITARSMLRDLFYVLLKHELILTNPMELTEILIRERGAERVVLGEEEMKRLLEAIRTHTGGGIRDRALFCV